MSRLLRSLIPRRQAVAASDDLARMFRNLQADPSVAAASRALEEAKLAQHFGRPDETFRNFELPLSTADEYAQADVGLFGNPAVRRMLQNAEFDQAIGQPMSNDVVEMLARNERMRTLEGINAQRGRATRGPNKGLPTNERQSLWDVAQQGIADARSARMADAVRSQGMSDMADAAGLAGLGALGAAGAAMTPFAFTNTDEPESALPVEERDVPGMGYDPYRAMLPPTARDDGSVYLEPGANMSPAEPVAEWLDRETTSILPFSPDIYVPPDEADAVAAMLERSAPSANMDELRTEDFLPPPKFDQPTPGEARSMEEAVFQAGMGGYLDSALQKGVIDQDRYDRWGEKALGMERMKDPREYGATMPQQTEANINALIYLGRVGEQRGLQLMRGAPLTTKELQFLNQLKGK